MNNLIKEQAVIGVSLNSLEAIAEKRMLFRLLPVNGQYIPPPPLTL